MCANATKGFLAMRKHWAEKVIDAFREAKPLHGQPFLADQLRKQVGCTSKSLFQEVLYYLQRKRYIDKPFNAGHWQWVHNDFIIRDEIDKHGYPKELV